MSAAGKKKEEENFYQRATQIFEELKELPKIVKTSIQEGTIRRRVDLKRKVEEVASPEATVNDSKNKSLQRKSMLRASTKEEGARPPRKQESQDLNLLEVVKASNKRDFTITKEGDYRSFNKEEEYEFADLVIGLTDRLKDSFLKEPTPVQLEVPNYDGGFFSPHWIVEGQNLPCCVTIEDDTFKLRESIVGEVVISFDVGLVRYVSYSSKLYDFIKIDYQSGGDYGPVKSVELAFVTKSSFDVFDSLLFVTFIREKRKRLTKNEAILHKLQTLDQKFRRKMESPLGSD